MFHWAFFLGTLLAACDDGSEDKITDTAEADALDVAGTYTANFGAIYEISELEVSVDYGTPDIYAVASFDNASGVIIAQNDPANSYNGGLWSRFEYVIDGKSVFWCQQAFAEKTEFDAENAARANRDDPATGGCGAPVKDFPYTVLTPSK